MYKRQIIIPIRPIIKNEPNLVKSLLVVYPYKLIAPKVLAVIKKTLAIDVWVNSINTEANERPIILANNQKVICAAETDILLILALK